MAILQFLPSVRRLLVLHFKVSTVQKNGESYPHFAGLNLADNCEEARSTDWQKIFLLCVVVEGSSRRAKINGHPYQAGLGSVLVQFISRYLRQAPLVGSFSIDYGDGSENVTFKMNSRFFKLCRVYSKEPRESVKCGRISFKDHS